MAITKTQFEQSGLRLVSGPGGTQIIGAPGQRTPYAVNVDAQTLQYLTSIGITPESITKQQYGDPNQNTFRYMDSSGQDTGTDWNTGSTNTFNMGSLDNAWTQYQQNQPAANPLPGQPGSSTYGVPTPGATQDAQGNWSSPPAPAATSFATPPTAQQTANALAQFGNTLPNTPAQTPAQAVNYTVPQSTNANNGVYKTWNGTNWDVFDTKGNPIDQATFESKRLNIDHINTRDVLAANAKPDFSTYKANSGTLTGSGTPTGGSTGGTQDYSGDINGAMSILPSPEVEGDKAKVDKSYQDIQDAITALGGEGAYQASQEDQTGLTAKKALLTDLQTRLQALNASTVSSQANLEGRPISMQAIVGASGELGRQNAIQANILNAQINTLQGNIQAGQDAVNRATDLKYAPVRAQLTALNVQLQQNRDALSSSEKKVADSLVMQNNMQLKLLDAQADSEKEVKNNLLDTMREYPDAGISLNDSLEVANQKVTTKSTIYKNQVRLVGGGTGGGTGTTSTVNGTPISDTTIPTITGKPRTDVQNTALGYAQRMQDADVVINNLGGQFTGLKSYISGSSFFPNALKSEDRQSFEQAQRNFINSVLRKESGAAISPSEFDSAAKQYFPQPGDSKGVIEQKNANRQRVIQSFLASSNTAPTSASGTYEDYLNAIK